MNMFRPALTLFALATFVTGVIYPVVITVFAQTLFPYQAGGSVLLQEGRPVDSELVGRTFEDPAEFHGRPSALAISYDPSNSGGSNFGPSHPDHLKAVQERIAQLRTENPDEAGAIPVDLVTTSGSGLDPHITPAAARFQAKRVASRRGVPVEEVLKQIAEQTEGRTFGVLGEPRVNVVLLNRTLEERFPRRR